MINQNLSKKYCTYTKESGCMEVVETEKGEVGIGTGISASSISASGSESIGGF